MKSEKREVGVCVDEKEKEEWECNRFLCKKTRIEKSASSN